MCLHVVRTCLCKAYLSLAMSILLSDNTKSMILRITCISVDILPILSRNHLDIYRDYSRRTYTQQSALFLYLTD